MNENKKIANEKKNEIIALWLKIALWVNIALWLKRGNSYIQLTFMKKENKRERSKIVLVEKVCY